MPRNPWMTLDTEALLRRQASLRETTSANVGAFPVPLGPVLTRTPVPSRPDEYEELTLPLPPPRRR